MVVEASSSATRLPMVNDETPESHEAWKAATDGTISQTRKTTDKVRSILADLDNQEAKKIEAAIKRRQLAEARAAAAEERRKKEAERRAHEAFKAMQAEEMRKAHQEMQAQKAAESQGLKQATANYKKARQDERDAKERERQIDNLYHGHTKVMKIALACLNESRMMYSYLKVCEMRIEAREQRFKRDLFRDYVEEALESERRALTESREELQAIQMQGEYLHDECKRLKVLLVTCFSRANTNRRRKQAMIDAASSKLPNSSSMPSLPAISPSSRLEPVEENTMASGHIYEGPTIGELLKVSYPLVKKALETIAIGEEALKRTRARCNAATAHTTKSLDLRKAELTEVKKTLEKQAVETDHAISDAKLRISGLKSFREPETPRSKKRAEDQLTAAEETLAAMEQLKQEIDADLSCKKHALKIDLFCRNVTTIRAGGHIPAEEKAE